MEAWNVTGEEGSRKVEGLSPRIRGPERKCSWGGLVGSVDTVSQLLSWNQAPGLPRTVPSMAAAAVESCRSGPSKRMPFARAADLPGGPGGSGRCLWLTDLGYLCGRETWKCVFSLENFLWLRVLRMGAGNCRVSVFEAVP